MILSIGFSLFPIFIKPPLRIYAVYEIITFLYTIFNSYHWGGKLVDHLWLLTEERPKPSVVLQIIKMYCKDFDDRITLHNEIKNTAAYQGRRFQLYMK